MVIIFVFYIVAINFLFIEKSEEPVENKKILLHVGVTHVIKGFTYLIYAGMPNDKVFDIYMNRYKLHYPISQKAICDDKRTINILEVNPEYLLISVEECD